MTWAINNGTGTFSTTGSQSLASTEVFFPFRRDVDLNGTVDYAGMYTSGSSFVSLINFNGATANVTLPGSGRSAGWYYGTKALFYVSLSLSSDFDYACKQTTGGTAGNVGTATHNYRCIIVSDVSGDGLVDVLVCTDSGYAINLTTSSSCSVGGPTSTSTGHKSTWLTTGDFNNDGKVDVATANYDDNSVSVVLRP